MHSKVFPIDLALDHEFVPGKSTKKTHVDINISISTYLQSYHPPKPPISSNIVHQFLILLFRMSENV